MDEIKDYLIGIQLRIDRLESDLYRHQQLSSNFATSQDVFNKEVVKAISSLSKKIDNLEKRRFQINLN